MAGSRTLKLSILAETKDLVAGLNAASKETQSFGDKATEFGKKAALAFAVAGAAALAFGADAVKAAAEDAAAQEKLADTIKATTNATATQIKGVEDYITKTSIAIGVTDDQLRPAFSRLVRSTKDTEEAQRLLNLALDLSVVAGKPVETVANALGKAYDGNTTALGKLGLGLDANLLKSKDNEAIIKSLEKTYGEFAEGAAETAAVKFERIRIATDEAKESIGAALLPVVERLSDYVLTTVVPNLESFIKGLTGQGSLDEASENATDSAYKFGEQVKKVVKTVIDLKDEIMVVTGLLVGMFVVSKISAGVMGTIALIKTLIATYNALKASAIVAGVASYFALNPLAGVAAAAIAAGVLVAANRLVSGDTSNSKGLVMGGGDTGAKGLKAGGTFTESGSLANEFMGAGLADPTELFNFNGQMVKGVIDATGISDAEASFRQQEALLFRMKNPGAFGPVVGPAGNSMQGANITVNVSGAIDAEGTARTIVDTLNNSFYRGTGGAGNLVSP
jgi:hypothetical protein